MALWSKEEFLSTGNWSIAPFSKIRSTGGWSTSRIYLVSLVTIFWPIFSISMAEFCTFPFQGIKLRLWKALLSLSLRWVFWPYFTHFMAFYGVFRPILAFFASFEILFQKQFSASISDF
jgi:hypothetical protein